MDKSQHPFLATELIVFALKRTTDYDFSEYSVAALDRRLQSFVEREKLNSQLDLLALIIDEDTELVTRLIQSLTVTHSAFFRDTEYFRLLQERVIPALKAYPKIRIWSLGCSTGEEAYSLAILLDLAGLLPRCSILGTDINTAAMQKAESGCYDLDRLDQLQQNFRALELEDHPSLLSYIEMKDQSFVFSERLRKACHFRQHNLVMDASLGTMHLITCRNVLIYLQPDEQERVIRDLIVPSLECTGFLMFGEAENITSLAQSLGLTKLSAGINMYQNTFNAQKIG